MRWFHAWENCNYIIVIVGIYSERFLKVNVLPQSYCWHGKKKSYICTVIVLYLHHNQSKSHPPNWILSIAKSVHFEFRSKPSGNKEVALDDNISSLNIEEESVPVKTIITMTSLDEWRLVASILDRMLFSLSFILLLLSLVYSMFTISMSPSHL